MRILFYCLFVFFWMSPFSEVSLSAQGSLPDSIELKLQDRPKELPPVSRKAKSRAAPGDSEPMVLRTLSPTQGASATISISPTLYWYQSQTSEGKLMFTLRDGRTTEVIKEPLAIREVVEAGTQSIDLSEKFQLEPGGLYIWTITYKPSRDVSYDVSARGELVMLEDSTQIHKEIAGLNAGARIQKLASVGAWYDVLREIQQLRQEGNSEPQLETLWNQILEQGGITLSEVSSEVSASS